MVERTFPILTSGNIIKMKFLEARYLRSDLRRYFYSFFFMFLCRIFTVAEICSHIRMEKIYTQYTFSCSRVYI